MWGEMASLHAGIAPGFFRAPRGTEHALWEVDRASHGADQAVLVAERDGRAVGFAHIAIYETPRSPAMVPRRRAQVEEILVAGEERRRGIGRRLVVAATEWSRARGADQILLTVWAGNPAAEGFYRALGFGLVSQVLSRDL
ncbi:MAG: GNAT family N-acetyltransferase [Myxococcales bacterium]|nr:GNAT family N-acetyltransferase [Myxococcales bacterium]